MPVVKITLNEKQMEILDHFRDTYGMTRAYAIRFLILDDLVQHQVKVMDKENPKPKR